MSLDKPSCDETSQVPAHYGHLVQEHFIGCSVPEKIELNMEPLWSAYFTTKKWTSNFFSLSMKEPNLISIWNAPLGYVFKY